MKIKKKEGEWARNGIEIYNVHFVQRKRELLGGYPHSPFLWHLSLSPVACRFSLHLVGLGQVTQPGRHFG